MKSTKLLLVLALGFSLLGASAPKGTAEAAAAADGASTASMKSSQFHFFDFRLAHVSAFQSGGNTFSGMLSLNPGFALTDQWGLRFGVGASAFKARQDTVFPVAETTAMGAYQLNEGLTLEAGGGMQMWLGNGGMMMMAGGNAVFPLKSKILLFDSVIGGYSYVMVPTKPTHIFRVAVGF